MTSGDRRTPVFRPEAWQSGRVRRPVSPQPVGRAHRRGRFAGDLDQVETHWSAGSAPRGTSVVGTRPTESKPAVPRVGPITQRDWLPGSRRARTQSAVDPTELLVVRSLPQKWEATKASAMQQVGSSYPRSTSGYMSVAIHPGLDSKRPYGYWASSLTAIRVGTRRCIPFRPVFRPS